MLLHIDASARRSSYSREVGDAVAGAWRQAHPEDSYVHRDLSVNPVPQIGEAWTELCDYLLANEISDMGRYKEAVRTPAQAAAWAIVEPLQAELVAADVVLIATPMYNFAIPASLKAWIDQVTFPKMKLTGRRVVVAYARGGTYVPGAPLEHYEHQESYLRDFFAFYFAIKDPVFVGTDLTMSVTDPALAGLRARHEESRTAALRAAREIGASL